MLGRLFAAGAVVLAFGAPAVSAQQPRRPGRSRPAARLELLTITPAVTPLQLGPPELVLAAPPLAARIAAARPAPQMATKPGRPDSAARIAGRVPPPGLPVAPAPATRRVVVTAVTMGTVYVAAGRNDGIREGVVLRASRLGPKGEYRVTFLSSKSAAARGDSLAPLPRVGDSVDYVPAKDPAATVVAQSRPSGQPGRSPRGARFRGRVGLRYLGSTDQSSGIALRQPGLELLMDGPLSRGSPVGVAADLRSRRSQVYRPGRETAINGSLGVYQANLRLQAPQGPFRAVLGRQYAPTLAGVGMFDGLLLDYQRPRFGVGVMGGLEPEPGTLALSSDIRQYGGFVQFRAPLSKPVRWGLTTGAMGSYAAGGVNREFGFVQATLSSRPVTAIVMQEIDYNRGWKRTAGEPALALTSSYASINVNGGEWLSLNGGIDNRRNVRLYRDLLTPEDAFDDRFRLGMWGGFNLNFARNKVRIGGDARTSTVDGQDSLRTNAYSANVSVERLTGLGLGARIRATRYETPGRGPGTLLAGSFRLAPPSVGALEVTSGSRRETGAPEADRYWAELNAEVFFRRSWFLLATFTREWGRANLTPTTDLLYAGLSYRF